MTRKLLFLVKVLMNNKLMKLFPIMYFVPGLPQPTRKAMCASNSPKRIRKTRIVLHQNPFTSYKQVHTPDCSSLSIHLGDLQFDEMSNMRFSPRQPPF